jgi:hypothetical protein
MRSAPQIRSRCRSLDALDRSTGSEAAVGPIDVFVDVDCLAIVYSEADVALPPGERLNHVAYYRAAVLAADGLAEFTRARDGRAVHYHRTLFDGNIWRQIRRGIFTKRLRPRPVGIVRNALHVAFVSRGGAVVQTNSLASNGIMLHYVAKQQL